MPVLSSLKDKTAWSIYDGTLSWERTRDTVFQVVMNPSTPSTEETSRKALCFKTPLDLTPYRRALLVMHATRIAMTAPYASLAVQPCLGDGTAVGDYFNVGWGTDYTAATGGTDDILVELRVSERVAHCPSHIMMLINSALHFDAMRADLESAIRVFIIGEI